MKNGRISRSGTVLPAMLRQLRVGTFTMAILVLAAINVNAATYYVATNGSDSNNCTQAQSTSTPKRNIMGSNGGLACLAAANGDVLDIRAGTYIESLSTNNQTWPSGTSYTNAATIRAHSGEVVIIKPTAGSGVALAGPTAYVIFDGMIIDGANCSSNCESVVWVGNGGNHIRFKNIEAKNGSSVVAAVNDQGSFVEFIGGRYHEAVNYAFYIEGDNDLVEGAKIYNARRYGIHIYGAGPNNNIVRSCELYNNGLHQAILLAAGDNNQAYNNLIRDNTGGGIGSGNGATNSKIYNNTITGNGTDGIATSNTSNPIIKNNIIYNNSGVSYINNGNTTGAVFGNNLCGSLGTGCAIVRDPLFIDPAASNFDLQAGSPAVDVGTTLADIPPFDMRSTARPQGAGWDIGAYEYRSTGSAPAPPTNVRIIK